MRGNLDQCPFLDWMVVTAAASPFACWMSCFHSRGFQEYRRPGCTRKSRPSSCPSRRGRRPVATAVNAREGSEMAPTVCPLLAA